MNTNLQLSASEEAELGTLPKSRIISIKQHAAPHLKKTFPGCVIGIHKDGFDTIVPMGKFKYHYMDPEPPVKVTDDTMYDIASITKAFVSVAMLMLIDRGHCSLDDKVKKVLPKYIGEHKEHVTIRHLLTCATRPKDTFIARTKKGAVNGGMILDMVRFGDLAFAPGEKFDYNNWSSITIGLIIEAITKVPLEKALQAMIISPLQLSSTTFTPTNPKEIPPTEFSFWRGGKSIQGIVHDETTFLINRDCKKFVGSAGLFSSVPDLLTFGKALLVPDRLLSEKMQEYLFSFKQVLPPNYKGDTYYGLGVDRVPDDYLCGCFAKYTIFMNGFQSSILMINSEKNFVFAQLSNALYPKRKQSVTAIQALRKEIIKEFVDCKHCFH